jgi:hypothetical protein
MHQRLECADCRAHDYLIDVDLIRLLDGVNDGPGDGVRCECGLAQIAEQLLGGLIGDVVAKLCCYDSRDMVVTRMSGFS